MPEITPPCSNHGSLHESRHTSLQQGSYPEVWVSLHGGMLYGSTASLPLYNHEPRSCDPKQF